MESKRVIATFKDEHGDINLKLIETKDNAKKFFVHWENAEKVVLDKNFKDFIKAQTYFDKIVLNYMLKYKSLKQTPVAIKPVKQVEMEIKELISMMQQNDRNRAFNVFTYIEKLNDILNLMKTKEGKGGLYSE